MKYGNWTMGQTEALLNLLGGEDEASAVLRGEKVLCVEVPEIKLFDKNGRRIPPQGLQSAVCDPPKNFYLVQPEFKQTKDYADRLLRFQETFHFGFGPLSAADFERKTRELLDELRSNKLLVSLLKGVYLPIVLPQLNYYKDYGNTLEQFFLPAVESSYRQQFPNRIFNNYRKGTLVNQVSIVPGTRHELLVERMKSGIVYAIYFPNPLQGFSVLASREQMSTLQFLLLSGGFDSSAAMVMYPDVLARDWHTPGYDLSALQWQSLDYSLCFEASGGELHFSYRAALGTADDGYSSGFLFLGSA